MKHLLFLGALLLTLESCTRCRQCITLDPTTKTEVKSERICDSRRDRTERIGERNSDGPSVNNPVPNPNEVICVNL
jgi:hypothetical protein